MKPPAPHPLIAVSTCPSQPQLVDEHPFKSPLQACLLHSSSIMLLAALTYAYCTWYDTMHGNLVILVIPGTLLPSVNSTFRDLFKLKKGETCAGRACVWYPWHAPFPFSSVFP